MIEYIAMAGGGIQDWWTGQVLPLLDTIHASPYFWPGIFAASLIFFLASRQIVK